MNAVLPSVVPWPTEDQFVAGSFRDRGGRVFESRGEIFRAVSDTALREFEAVSGLPFVDRGMQNRDIVPTRICRRRQPADDGSPWAAVLHHERVPLITWPYEWCFSMLKDAARHQLQLMREALADDAVFKDATPYNIQFRGVAPILIDTGSIVQLRPGTTWDGYRQFCQLFLYPLMLQAYRGIDFQPLLRGRLDGITPEQARRLMSLWDVLKRGVLSHVVLHSRLAASDRRQGMRPPAVAKSRIPDSLRASGFGKAMIEHNVAGLERLVDRLHWSPRRSTWSDYDAESEPVRRDSAAKEQFVREVLATRHWSQTWDIGCNLGRYSRIAAEHSDCVVALDSDHLTVDRLYQALRHENTRNITPLVYNPADPSPDLGWRCRERTRFSHRGRPDLILFLAVIHHLVIGANLLLPDLMAWLAEQRAALVIEFVDRNDPQVRALLAHRDDVFSDYSREMFEQCLRRSFTVLRTRVLPSDHRTLYFVEPRS